MRTALVVLLGLLVCSAAAVAAQTPDASASQSSAASVLLGEDTTSGLSAPFLASSLSLCTTGCSQGRGCHAQLPGAYTTESCIQGAITVSWPSAQNIVAMKTLQDGNGDWLIGFFNSTADQCTSSGSLSTLTRNPARAGTCADASFTFNGTPVQNFVIQDSSASSSTGSGGGGTPSKSGDSNKKKAIGITIAVAIVVLIVGVAVYCYRRRKAQALEADLQGARYNYIEP